MNFWLGSICRERLAQPAGGADEPAVCSHAAPGERAGLGQAVCRDPPFHPQLRWTKGEGNLCCCCSNYSPQMLTFTVLKHQYGRWAAFVKLNATFSLAVQMTNPAIQNDFSYYRRTISRNRLNNQQVRQAWLRLFALHTWSNGSARLQFPSLIINEVGVSVSFQRRKDVYNQYFI